MTKIIMIVDDEADVRQLVRELLISEGYDVITASNGEEALSKLRKARVDLVLVDFFMPGMSGRELCEKIRADAKLKDLKLAFLTVAEYGKEGHYQLKKLRISDYIQKPFDNDELIKRIKKIIQ